MKTATDGTMKRCLDMVSEDIVDNTHSCAFDGSGVMVIQQIIDLSLHNSSGENDDGGGCPIQSS